MNYKEHSGAPRGKDWRRRVRLLVVAIQEGCKRSSGYFKNAEMSTLGGAKEGIWVTCGFLVVPFTGIEDKRKRERLGLG